MFASIIICSVNLVATSLLNIKPQFVGRVAVGGIGLRVSSQLALPVSEGYYAMGIHPDEFRFKRTHAVVIAMKTRCAIERSVIMRSDKLAFPRLQQT